MFSTKVIRPKIILKTDRAHAQPFVHTHTHTARSMDMPTSTMSPTRGCTYENTSPCSVAVFLPMNRQRKRRARSPTPVAKRLRFNDDDDAAVNAEANEADYATVPDDVLANEYDEDDKIHADPCAGRIFINREWRLVLRGLVVAARTVGLVKIPPPVVVLRDLSGLIRCRTASLARRAVYFLKDNLHCLPYEIRKDIVVMRALSMHFRKTRRETRMETLFQNARNTTLGRVNESVVEAIERLLVIADPEGLRFSMWMVCKLMGDTHTPLAAYYVRRVDRFFGNVLRIFERNFRDSAANIGALDVDHSITERQSKITRYAAAALGEMNLRAAEQIQLARVLTQSHCRGIFVFLTSPPWSELMDAMVALNYSLAVNASQRHGSELISTAWVQMNADGAREALDKRAYGVLSGTLSALHAAFYDGAPYPNAANIECAVAAMTGDHASLHRLRRRCDERTCIAAIIADDLVSVQTCVSILGGVSQPVYHIAFVLGKTHILTWLGSNRGCNDHAPSRAFELGKALVRGQHSAAVDCASRLWQFDDARLKSTLGAILEDPMSSLYN